MHKRQKLPGEVVGFSIRFSYPHYCERVFQTGRDIYAVATTPECFGKYRPYTRAQIDAVPGSIYLFNETEREIFQKTHDATNSKVIFAGHDDLENGIALQQRLTVDHFVYGDLKAIAGQLQGVHWTRISRDPEHAQKFVPIMTDRDKQLQILTQLYENYKSSPQSDDYVRLVRQMSDLDYAPGELATASDRPPSTWVSLSI